MNDYWETYYKKQFYLAEINLKTALDVIRNKDST